MMSGPTTWARHNEFLLEMLNQGEISHSVYDYLFNKECRTSVLFFLPKIHKQISPCPGCPVVSSVDSCTEKISQLIDHFLNPCATRVRSYVKDTTHFLSIIDQQGQLPDNSWLVSLDVQSLYTNIDHATGLFSAREALDNFRPGPNVKPSNKSLIKLTEFVLTKNNFKFNGENFLQTSGVSNGNKDGSQFGKLEPILESNS